MCKCVCVTTYIIIMHQFIEYTYIMPPVSINMSVIQLQDHLVKNHLFMYVTGPAKRSKCHCEHINLTIFLNQVRTWFLEITFVHDISMCVCVCLPINYIDVILNQYNQLNKFVAFRNVTKLSMHRHGLYSFVTKHIVTETKVISLC